MLMLLLAHIVIALISVVFASLLFLSPSNFKFKANYLLIGATLVSGTYLVIDRSSHLVESCAVGLAYIGVVLFAIAAAKRKYAKQTITER
jgi:hypothetical protein